MTEEKQNEAVKLAVRQNDEYLEQAKRTKSDLETTVGNTDRKRHAELNTVIFLTTLIDQCNGTFVWEGPRKGDKYGTIFEALAGKMKEFSELNFRGKAEHIDEMAPRMRYGFNGARKWLAEWFNGTVYCVPQNNESAMQTVLTLNPNFKVESGRTAAEMQADRDYKLAYGQMKSSAMRIVASSDDQQANSVIDDIMQKVKLAMQEDLAEREKLQAKRNNLLG